MNENTIPILDLIPYVNNARTHSDEQIAQIASSIKEFGFINPIIVDGDNGIIAGHGRLMAAKKIGIKEVPIVDASHLTEAQKKAYIIADNKMALNAEWDEELLALELTDLKDLEFDLSLTGFDKDELADLMQDDGTEGLTDEDAIPETPEEPTSKRGDIWILGDHRLMCGDSTMIDDVEKLMDGNKADMVFTDPPYGVEYKGINNDSRSGLSELLGGVFLNYLSSSKSGASIYCFHSDKCADIFNIEFRKTFHFSSMIIWAKNSLTLSQTDYQSQHEPCLYGWMDNGTHSWHSDRKQTSVWRFDKERVEGHTTPKPVGLIERAINNSSKSGDITIDFFGGSGSTLIACEKTNRNCYMMELDEKYCDVIIKRWEQFTGKKATLESTGEEFKEAA